MISRPIVLALLGAGCLAAAAGGAYVAVRQNAAEQARLAPAEPLPAANAEQPAPVVETEAALAPEPEQTEPAAPSEVEDAPAKPPVAVEGEVEAAEPPRTARVDKEARRNPPPERPARPQRRDPAPRTAEVPGASVPEPEPIPPVPAEPPPLDVPPATVQPVAPPPPPEPRFVEVVVPASSVIGLQVETSLSSESAEVEDRVDARVTRDVTADGRIAIPAGSRAIGSVTLVERGGKLKDRARLGVRFHTLVLADGSEIPIYTETVFREGDSPGAESSRKIGGAAIGGAILGAILGGGKGAAIGGAAGAGAGTAAVMAGGRNAAVLPAGTGLTVRLAEPVPVQIERQ